LWNLTADTLITDWTSVTASDSVEISIPAGSLVMANSNNKRELFELTVVANKDLDTAIPETVRFNIINLRAF